MAQTWSVLLYIRIGLCGLTMIVLPVLLYYFYRLRSHFVISARNPFITILVSILCLLTSILAVILAIIECETKSNIPVVIVTATRRLMSYLIMGLIAYRLYSIHQKWEATVFRHSYHNALRSCNSASQSSIKIDTSIEILRKESTHSRLIFCDKIRRCCFSNKLAGILLIISSIIVAVLSGLPFIYPNWMHICAGLNGLFWVILCIISVALIHKSLKVENNLKCIKETYFALAIVVIQATVTIALGRLMMEDIARFTGTVLVLLLAFYILFTSFYIIKKLEGTIIPDKIFSKANSSMSQLSIELSDNSSNSKGECKNQLNLKQFLDKSIDNYNIFYNFLTKSLALENLLFFTKIVILRHNLWKLREQYAPVSPQSPQNTTNMEPLSRNDNKYFKNGFELTFPYLKGTCTSDITPETISESINYIYNQYILDEAPDAINISYNTRNKLITFMTNNKDIKLDNIDSIMRYLTLFDRSAKQIWNLLSSVYQYRFYTE